MGNWHDLNAQIRTYIQQGQILQHAAFDQVRREALIKLHEVTGRNTIIYYSGWLQKMDLQRSHGRDFSIHDGDKNGFMAVIHRLDRSKGLDLLLHTPGGDLAATESLVDYLHAKFADIRVVVPQIAMSAGTMIACAANRILMGDQSSLGPIDPQIGGLPAHGILEEFEQAAKEIAQDPSRIPLWQPIIAKYTPSLIGECMKATHMSQEIVATWLENRMFQGQRGAKSKAKKVVEELGDHAITKSHARHISKAKAQAIGLVIESLEAKGADDLQEAVLTVHHACVHTLSSTPALKIIENHMGSAFIEQVMVPSGN
ncbi:MAG: ATP-dependent Clp protease proteolytic subunit [Acidobacteria bacterium]|nr:ATP-dependent Clp protease proteolytic subunit [Acidobacteriota bacterium]